LFSSIINALMCALDPQETGIVSKEISQNQSCLLLHRDKASGSADYAC